MSPERVCFVNMHRAAGVVRVQINPAVGRAHVERVLSK
jgi:hypothetical protein